MADDYVATVRIRRPAKVSVDDRGHSVWSETVQTAQLELVSTAELQAILESDDAQTHSEIKRLLSANEDGVLARDPATGLFEVIGDDELQAILDQGGDLPKMRRPADVTLEAAGPAQTSGELSLVSTQMLRKVVLKDDAPSGTRRKSGRTDQGGKDEFGGFNPYNNT